MDRPIAAFTARCLFAVSIIAIALLAACLARLDDDRALLRQLGERASARAAEHFDERVVIRRTIEVYDELLRDRRVATPARVAGERAQA